MTVLNLKRTRSHLQSLAFLDPEGPIGIQRFETLKYKQFDKLTDKQLGFFWRPEEVDVLREDKDFKELTPHEQHIFTSNLKRQILLDSVQGRSPNLAFLPLATIPELETWIETWAFNETIHSRSYTHIIRNVYPDPSAVFDQLLEIDQIINCAQDISYYYDDLIETSLAHRYLGAGTHQVNGNTVTLDTYDLKRRLWLAINSVNALEGIRFYVSFACSWAFAELKKMEGNAKIIKLIARDENVHLGFTQTLLKLLPNDDPDFVTIKQECQEQVVEMFRTVVEQERAWAHYLFADGSMIGLNEVLLADYVEWIAHKRMTALGLPAVFRGGTNPLPWTQKWIAGAEVQVAPQETEITSYVIGGTKQDITDKTFEGLTL